MPGKPKVERKNAVLSKSCSVGSSRELNTGLGLPNILIGSFANISFNDFVVNLTPGVLLALFGLVVYGADRLSGPERDHRQRPPGDSIR